MHNTDDMNRHHHNPSHHHGGPGIGGGFDSAFRAHHGRGHGPHGGFGGFDPAGGFGPGFGGGFGHGPGGRGRSRANRGDVRSAILSLLAEGPSSGYGLIKAIAEKTGGSWRPSPGSVYPTLQQLVDEELVDATGDSRRTEYDLSETGRDYVTEHAEELERAWESNPRPSEAGVALFESVGKLMGVVGQFRFSATDAQRTAATEKIDEARRALYLILAE